MGLGLGLDKIGADVIGEVFTRHDVKRLFVFPGGTIAPVFDVAVKLGIDIFCARHEQGAGYAALAAARLSQKPQVVMVTSGPGVTNLVTPIADAYFDSTPLVVLTGQVGTGDLRGKLPVRQRGFQEVDTVALLAPITKAQFLPTQPSDLAEILDHAFYLASDGRPGPVLVDLPMNVQRSAVKPSNTRSALPIAVEPPGLDPAAIVQVADWLCAAKQPVILAGQGVLLSRGYKELRSLAERGQIPVSQSLLALGAFPTASPLALGHHGHTGNQYAGLAIHNADLVLVLGSRLDVRQTGSRVDTFVPNGKVVHVDLDPGELHNPRVRTDLKIWSDVRTFLRALDEPLRSRKFPDWSGWRKQIAAWRKEFPLRYATDGPLKPQSIIEAANRLTAGRPVVCISGVGSHQQWVARHFDFDYPTRPWLTSGGHGAMGYDLPTAIGAQLARSDACVLCIVGDGSLQINIQELASAVAHNLPIKIIVLDNHRLGIVSQFQNLNWKSDPTCGDKWNPDFAAIARAYGIAAETVRTADEIEPALQHLFASRGPYMVHCVIDPAEDIVPMLLAGQAMDKMWPYG